MMRRLSCGMGVLTVAALLFCSIPLAGQDGREWLEVMDDEENGELVFLLGPLDLPAEAGHGAIAQPPLLTAIVPVDGYLYGYDVQMEDATGQPIDIALLHHINLIDPEHRELFSPIARRLFAASSETPATALPRFLGIPVQKGRRINVSAMFHNPTQTSYTGVRLRVRLSYRARGWLFPLQVYPVYVEVMGPVGAKDFDLPPGRSERSWEGSPAIAGRLLAAGGHLHDHAVELRFEDVTANKVLWRSEPVVVEGRVVETPVGKFWWKGGIGLRPDHTYRLTVVYDNPTGMTLPAGGMGVLGGVFLPRRGASWPALDPTDPLYVADLEATRLTAERRALGMAGAASGAAAAGGHVHHQH